MPDALQRFLLLRAESKSSSRKSKRKEISFIKRIKKERKKHLENGGKTCKRNVQAGKNLVRRERNLCAERDVYLGCLHDKSVSFVF